MDSPSTVEESPEHNATKDEEDMNAIMKGIWNRRLVPDVENTTSSAHSSLGTGKEEQILIQSF
eukprot:6424260-Ditylum_brightwellii.AAC.1